MGGQSTTLGGRRGRDSKNSVQRRRRGDVSFARISQTPTPDWMKLDRQRRKKERGEKKTNRKKKKRRWTRNRKKKRRRRKKVVGAGFTRKKRVTATINWRKLLVVQSRPHSNNSLSL